MYLSRTLIFTVGGCGPLRRVFSDTPLPPSNSPYCCVVIRRLTPSANLFQAALQATYIRVLFVLLNG
jgi:hypothetical protein